MDPLWHASSDIKEAPYLSAVVLAQASRGVG